MIDSLPIGLKDDGIFDHGDVFAILPDARRKHMAIFGATGAGKSTLLRNMIACDIAARRRCDRGRPARRPGG